MFITQQICGNRWRLKPMSCMKDDHNSICGIFQAKVSIQQKILYNHRLLDDL